MKKLSRSIGGITPFPGTFLMLAVAVSLTSIIVTYSWLLTFEGSTTSQKETSLNIEQVSFYTTTTTDYVEIIIKNSGLINALVDAVYAGTSPSNLLLQNNVNYDPTTQVVIPNSTLKITIKCDWTDGTKYYFKIATLAGQIVLFSEKAQI